ncbi:hypothetical protein EKQ44_07180 [Sutcliffiella horikoshii]|nr:hypothetical protein [Sutcliffiella horikoshii]
MGWRDYDPSTGRFIVPDEYEGEEDEPTSLNRYLYADADPVNNIDPDGHAPKWLQKGWKSSKKIAKKGLKFGVLDDINTLRSPNSKWYHKAGAAASLASNFVPGAGVAKFGVKLGAKAISKGAKGLKAKKFVATTVKQNRTVKVKKQAVMAKAKPKPLQSVNKGNTRKSNNHTKGKVNFSKKPYNKSRPSYGKGQVEQVWESAKDPKNGKVYDPSGAEIIWDKSKPRNGQWDMGHIPGEKYSEVHELYMKGIISKKEFLEWYRNPKNYRPELPSTNRGHKYEKRR